MQEPDHEAEGAHPDQAAGLHPLLDPEHAPLPKQGWYRRHHWVTVLMPFLVYMFVQALAESRLDLPDAIPSPATQRSEVAGEPEGNEAEENAAAKLMREQRELQEKHEKAIKIPYKYYPRIYTAKIGLTLLAMLLVIPGYRAFPGRSHLIGVAVGVLGAVLWIGLCRLHLEQRLLEPIGLGKLLDMGRRPGFNPLEQIADPTWARIFLAIRFFGLVIVVPIVEEFFLRGFLMRYVISVDWPLIPFGVTTTLALAVGTLVPMLMHPAEIIAAAVWFSLVTWLMLRTRSIWDCIAAHAVTNLLIGLWVLWSGDWFLM